MEKKPLKYRKAFTSQEAAQLTGCTVRQLQYWREQEVVVPDINAPGTGRSIYYSRRDLVKLAAMQYCLSIGLNFDICRKALKILEKANNAQQDLWITSEIRRFMFWRETTEKSLELVPFDLDLALASLREGQPAIPLWLDKIRERVAMRLEEADDIH
ncbi:MAG: MerR family transcriptional regulator [Chroococcidiopsidaceae cyanobacterium CP_BM_RX_35]|nr:MerR family transcriptional regulator [Chroococcidiopsidaceae cyanobacterium CP_BM_RX_35]